MQEKNKHTLQRAIRELPDFSPSPLLWDQIEEELDISKQNDLIKEASHHLPEFSPPAELWDTIASALEPQTARRIRLWSRQNLQRAAAVLLLITAGWQFWYYQTTRAHITIINSEEPQASNLLDKDWDTEEHLFAQVSTSYAHFKQRFGEPQSDELSTELEELNAAKSALKEAMDVYGTDAELIRQLAKVERDRSKVLRQMAANM